MAASLAETFSVTVNLFATELIKLKNTYALWMTLLGAGFMPLLLFCAYATSTNEFIPAAGQNPWDEYLLRSFNGCCLFSSGFVLLITALVINVEHKAHGWRQLFTLPVSRSRVFSVKLAFTLAVIVVFTVLDALFTLCLGHILGMTHHELGFSDHPIPMSYVSGFVLDFTASILPVVMLQFWLCLRVDSLVVSLGVGLSGLLVGLLFKSFTFIVYFPYALPFQLWNYTMQDHQMTNGLVVYRLIWVELAYTALILAASHRDFIRRFQP